jgi:ubiquinone/menaquinone biosynthesis C-methylase UbiE
MELKMQDNEYKKNIEDVFDKASSGYDNFELKFFNNSAKHLVDFINLNESDKLIDVATGTGHVALKAATVLSQGRVTAIDLSSKMLEQAKSKMLELNYNNIDFKKCDMESIELKKNYYNAASCAFGLFFLKDMEKGLKSIINVIKPGGVLALSSFTESFFEPLRSKFLALIKQYGVELHPPSWERLDSKEKLSKILRKAKCKNIAITKKQLGYYVKDSSGWWNMLWSLGYRDLLEKLSELDLVKFKQEHLQEVDKHMTEKGIWLNIEVLYSKAIVVK